MRKDRGGKEEQTLTLVTNHRLIYRDGGRKGGEEARRWKSERISLCVG